MIHVSIEISLILFNSLIINYVLLQWFIINILINISNILLYCLVISSWLQLVLLFFMINHRLFFSIRLILLIITNNMITIINCNFLL
jgi:hypothetical protein